jgi:hypothetical protein
MRTQRARMIGRREGRQHRGGGWVDHAGAGVATSTGVGRWQPSRRVHLGSPEDLTILDPLRTSPPRLGYHEAHLRSTVVLVPHIAAAPSREAHAPSLTWQSSSPATKATSSGRRIGGSSGPAAGGEAHTWWQSLHPRGKHWSPHPCDGPRANGWVRAGSEARVPAPDGRVRTSAGGARARSSVPLDGANYAKAAFCRQLTPLVGLLTFGKRTQPRPPKIKQCFRLFGCPSITDS